MDPFLHSWDEQFHALVAKNLSYDPLSPILINNPLFGFDYKSWVYNHIWLHKQPFFLWLIALSLKLFGYTEIALRTPSIILHVFLAFATYKIGKLSFSKNIGLIAAFLISTAFFPLELVSGFIETDHNDATFLPLLAITFWFWFEYQKSKEIKWSFLIGIFCAFAMLTKWLMGGLPLFIWFLTLFINYTRKEFLHLALSLSICLILFLPWQIYTYLNFKNEFLHELSLMSKHFNTIIEGHGGDLDFYFNEGFKALYGSGILTPIIIFLGIILFFKYSSNLKHKLFIGLSILFIYTFYTVAKTKMYAFPIIVFPFAMIFIAITINKLFLVIIKFIPNRTIYITIITLLTLVSGIIIANPKRIISNHSNEKSHSNLKRLKELKEKDFIIHIQKELKNDKYIIFNCNLSEFGDIPFLFYTNHDAFKIIPTEKQLEDLLKTNNRIAVIDLGELPFYILSNKKVKILNAEKFV